MLTAVTNPVAVFWNAAFGSRSSSRRALSGLPRSMTNFDSTSSQGVNNGNLAFGELSKILLSSEMRDLLRVCSSARLPSAAEIMPVDFLDMFKDCYKTLTVNDVLCSAKREKGWYSFSMPGSNVKLLASTYRPGRILLQKRGFRTRAATGLGQDSSGTARSEQKHALGNIFNLAGKTSDAEPATSSGHKSFAKLLADAPDDRSRKALKEGFSEGYLTATGAGEKKKNALWVIRQIALIAILLYICWPFISDGTGRSLFKSIHTEVNAEEVKVTFSDVKAIDEAKAEVMQIVEFLKDPERFCRLGARLPKGVLLVGPPGTGKTLLARAIAGEAGVPFFRAAGSEFEEMLVGQGARRVRELFAAARQKAPCVVFIDEIDSCGSRRTSSALHPYANQMINQLLTEMDGFEANEGVIILAATNRRDDLDPALMRPGRFDVEIHVSNPDLKGRQDIFKLYISKIVAGKDVDTDLLARRTVGFSGADIESMVNQAALKAAADNKDDVNMHYLEAARDFVISGPSKTRIPDEATNLLTAYHEAGHALVAYFTPDAVPLDRATIIPRGGALGHTSFIPDKEQYHQTRAELLAALDSAMGGRAAEELIYGASKVTTGAASDLKKATEIATLMVKHAGMSEKVGLRTFDPTREDVLIVVNEIGPTTNEAIDNEIKRLLQESYERAKAILKQHAAAHKRLAEALLEHETLDFKEMKAFIEGDTVFKQH